MSNLIKLQPFQSCEQNTAKIRRACVGVTLELTYLCKPQNVGATVFSYDDHVGVTTGVCLRSSLAPGLATMSGVWNFNANGVVSREENPLAQTSYPGPSSGHKILVHVESNETMMSYVQLDAKMLMLGWHVYAHGNPNTKQYHRSYNTPDLITLPISFHGIRTTHMYDIVVKTQSAFQVQNAS